MVSAHYISAGQAEEYFEHELDYYSGNITNHDRWHGALAEARGYTGELSKEQFDHLCQEVASIRGKKRTNNGKEEHNVGLDVTFSAPKSVSLLMAESDATQEAIIAAHGKAVAKTLEKIEMQYLKARPNKQSTYTRNAAIAEFTHLTARPTAENDFMPDLDLHSHCAILDETFYDGRNLAQDYGKILDNIHYIGLLYRIELAQEIQKLGYEIEVTDRKQGFFEVKGFDREIIENYSHRTKEILKTSEEQGISIQDAKLKSRTSKSATRGSYQDIIEATRADLFESGKVLLERNVENGRNENIREQGIDYSRAARAYESPYLHAGRAGESDLADHRGIGSGAEKSPNFTSEFSLPHLQMGDLASQEPSSRSDLFLSRDEIVLLAECQTARIRNSFVRSETTDDRRERIKEVAAETIKDLSHQEFAFSVKVAQRAVMAEGFELGISEEEALQGIQDCGLAVNLGRMGKNKELKDRTPEEIKAYEYAKAIKTKNGTWIPEKEQTGKGSDVYLSTEQNIKTEREIMRLAENGKGTIEKGVLTTEQSREALENAEERAREIAEGNGSHFFYLNDEQTAAVHHVMCSNDAVIAICGLAGTGKTTGTINRIKMICDEQGIEIKGVCFTGQAAQGLQADASIDSTTIHSFLSKLERESGGTPPEGQLDVDEDGQRKIRSEWDFSEVRKADKRELWVVDEAGLVNNDLMLQLLIAAEMRGAQVVLMGDPKQLPPIGVGQAMKELIERAKIATAYLEKIQRQRDQELLQAVKDSIAEDKDGNLYLKTFATLDKRGDYIQIEDKKERQERIVAEMTQGSLESYGENLLLVGTNRERNAYNEAIRNVYVERGELEKGQEYTIEVQEPNGKIHEETRFFAKGDRLIFLENDFREMGVMNGTIGEVEYINGKYIGVIIERERNGHKYYDLVEIDTERYKKFDYAYALTEYKAQGKTVVKVVADMSTAGPKKDRNNLYVDISRAKEKAVIYTDNKEKLEKETKTYCKKLTSRDFAERINELDVDKGIKESDKYHAAEDNTEERVKRQLEAVKEHTLGIKRDDPKEQEKKNEKPQEQERDTERVQKSERAAAPESEKTDPEPSRQQRQNTKGIISDRFVSSDLSESEKVKTWNKCLAAADKESFQGIYNDYKIRQDGEGRYYFDMGRDKNGNTRHFKDFDTAAKAADRRMGDYTRQKIQSSIDSSFEKEREQKAEKPQEQEQEAERVQKSERAAAPKTEKTDPEREQPQKTENMKEVEEMTEIEAIFAEAKAEDTAKRQGFVHDKEARLQEREQTQEKREELTSCLDSDSRLDSGMKAEIWNETMDDLNMKDNQVRIDYESGKYYLEGDPTEQFSTQEEAMKAYSSDTVDIDTVKERLETNRENFDVEQALDERRERDEELDFEYGTEDHGEPPQEREQEQTREQERYEDIAERIEATKEREPTQEQERYKEITERIEARREREQQKEQELSVGHSQGDESPKGSPQGSQRKFTLTPSKADEIAKIKQELAEKEREKNNPTIEREERTKTEEYVITR